MKRTLKYTLLLLLLTALASTATAQEAGMRMRGIRIGYDLASLSLLYFDPDRMVYSFSFDYEAMQDIYPVLEFGFQNVGIEKENYNYRSNGFFGRAGVDVNLLKYEQTNVYEMFYAGLRYGVSFFKHQADNITVPDDYFEGVNGAQIPDNRLNAHWISLVAGVKVELFTNFFMGWSVFGNIKLAQTKDPHMSPYHVPGFGKGDKRAGVVINYTVAYRLPTGTYKPRKIIKRKDTTVEPEPVPLQE
jgi:hypothetical protein